MTPDEKAQSARREAAALRAALARLNRAEVTKSSDPAANHDADAMLRLWDEME